MKDPRFLGWSASVPADTLVDMDTTTAPGLGEAASHEHSRRCWWDHEQVRWVCSPATGPAAEPDPAVTDAPGPVDPRDTVDVRDMLVVHTALLREFRLAPAAVARVPVGAASRAATVDRHLGLICDLLHHHHAGEDELLWPPLRSRLPAPALTRLDEAEDQHAGLDTALGRVLTTRRAWVERVDTERRDALVGSLHELHHLLAEHLDFEERALLPLAATHLTDAEWKAVGEAGAAAVPRKDLPLVFGMFAYEGDPDVLATMLEAAPALPRVLVPRIAPRVYARRAAQLYGTRRP